MAQSSIQGLKSFINHRYQKSIGALAPMLLLVLYCGGQPTFSKRYTIGGNTSSHGVREVGDGYIIHGGGSISNPSDFDQYLLKLDYEGNIIEERIDQNDTIVYNPRYATAQLADGTVLVGSVSSIADSVWVELHWVDQDLEIVHQRSYTSPVYDPEDSEFSAYVGLYGLEATSGGLIYLILATYESETGNDYVVLQLNQEGEVNWSYKRNLDSGLDRCRGTAVKGDSLLVSNLTTFSGKQIYALTPSGSVAWEFEFTDSYGGGNHPSDLFWNGQSIICAANAYFDSPELIRQPLIHATDTLGNMLWFGAVGDDFGWDQFMYGVEEVCNGYVGFSQKNTGVAPDLNWNNTLCWVIRVEEGGELAWERKYGFAETSAYENKFTDIIATSDGGVLLCGYSINVFSPTPPDQQAWFLKLDACGCLVPGCDPDCSNPCAPWSEIPEGQFFLFGPNPVSDVLNLYVKQDISALAHPEFVLRNPLGQVVDYFVPNDTDITYLWPIALPSGGYVLSLEDNGVPVQVERMVVH